MTAEKLISAALRKLGVLGPGKTMSAYQAQTGLEALNVMLSGWGAEGFVTFVFPTLASELHLDDGYERAIAFNLPIELAPEYGRDVKPSVMRVAMASKRVIKRATTVVQTLRVDEFCAGHYDIINDTYV